MLFKHKSNLQVPCGLFEFRLRLQQLSLNEWAHQDC